MADWNPIGKMADRLRREMKNDPAHQKKMQKVRKGARAKVRNALGLDDAKPVQQRRKEADAKKPAKLQSDGVYR